MPSFASEATRQVTGFLASGLNESHDLPGYARACAREPLRWPRDHYFSLLFSE